MADYSGWWSCPHCPASGDYRGIDRPHDDDCPAHLKAVVTANERRKEKEREQKEREAWIERYRSMNGDDLIALLRATRNDAGDIYAQYKELDDQAKLMLEVIREDDELSRKFLRGV